MYATYLDQTPVLSPKTVNAVREEYTNLAIGDVDDTGFRTILNPFNLVQVQADQPGAAAAVSTSVLDPALLLLSSNRVQPAYLKIPEFVEGVQTLEFMGFEISTALLIWHKYRNGRPHCSTIAVVIEDLLSCAIQYLAYVESQATRDGIHDQRIIKELMGFHYGETLFRIDTEVPVTSSVTPLLGPRVLLWIIPIISRRYKFIYDLEGCLADSSISGWSARTEARTMNMPPDEETANSVFELFDGFDGTPIQEDAPANMLLPEEEAMMANALANGLDDATKLYDSLFPEDMTLCKESVLSKAHLNGNQFDELDCGTNLIEDVLCVGFLPDERESPYAIEEV